MAKKQAGGSRKKATKRKELGFVLNVTNLKFIGAAFDVAIADLKAIKSVARNKSKVTAKISALQKLKVATSRECPQSWYPRFETK